MKRKKKREHKGIYVPFDSTLLDFSAWLNEQIKEFGPDAILSAEVWDEHMETSISYERDETDKEMEKRYKDMEVEKQFKLKQAQKREEEDKREYERLKKKFEENDV